MNELLLENRARGWAAVDEETCPDWAVRRIIAFRQAAIEGHEYRMSAEERSLAEAMIQKAAKFAKRLFPDNSLRSLRAQAERQARQIRDDEFRSATAVKAIYENGRVVRFERDYIREAELQAIADVKAQRDAEQLAEIRAEIEPWNVR